MHNDEAILILSVGASAHALSWGSWIKTEALSWSSWIRTEALSISKLAFLDQDRGSEMEFLDQDRGSKLAFCGWRSADWHAERAVLEYQECNTFAIFCDLLRKYSKVCKLTAIRQCMYVPVGWIAMPFALDHDCVVDKEGDKAKDRKG